MTAPADRGLLEPPAVVRLGTVGSTQTEAFALAARGAPDGTVVVADHQRAGRGRRGRSWLDAAGQSLLVSIVVRPRLAPPRLPLLSYAAAVAVAEALAGAGLAARLKWPNDVLVGGRKIAGILLETRGPGPVATVVGIGINVGRDAVPPGLADRATSVEAEGGAADREALLRGLLGAFDAWRRRLEAEGFDPVRVRWLALSDTVGRQVAVDGARGTAVDLDADGALVLEAAGARRRVVAGELAE